MTVIDEENPAEPKRVIAQPNDSLPLVIDAGFDAFVRRYWDELVAGASREFQFPFADRSSLVEMRIKPLTCSYATKTEQCFRLELANWFLRMVVKPIELGYDAGSRRLTRYRGLSNIGDGKGNGLVVDIHYDYGGIAAPACQRIKQTQTDKAVAGAMPGGQS